MVALRVHDEIYVFIRNLEMHKPYVGECVKESTQYMDIQWALKW